MALGVTGGSTGQVTMMTGNINDRAWVWTGMAEEDIVTGQLDVLQATLLPQLDQPLCPLLLTGIG